MEYSPSPQVQNAPLLLLVDDEAGILATLGPLIADMGYRVLTASSGQQALDLFSQNAPALIVSDIRMPGLDGMQLLQAIKAQQPETEVLMLTGHGDMSLAVESLRSGAGDFLTKPVNADVLEFALARAVERINMRNAIRRHTQELEKLVERRTKELLGAERLAAIGETAGGMAHAIKNLAGGLEGAMFVLEKGLELDNREYLEQGWHMLRNDVARVRDLTINLLNLSRPAELDPQPADPASVAQEVVRLLATRTNEAGATLTCDEEASGHHPADGQSPLSATALPVFDQSAIHSCLMNLVVNAIDAVADAVATGLLQRGDGRITIAVTATPVVVRWTVLDNGSGIPAEAAAALEKGRFTTKPTGSGFGLMATRKAMREQGGELRVTAPPQGGTKAELVLPAKPVC
ncbi:response regulator [Oleidesulfovibrio sp.]|uniref:hybrid sensor histidine kinase/response regulator n=1 Tax=Oleidesulfovibrio sp. TaxID=2909707 RepID=UPI003A883DA3